MNTIAPRSDIIAVLDNLWNDPTSRLSGLPRDIKDFVLPIFIEKELTPIISKENYLKLSRREQDDYTQDRHEKLTMLWSQSLTHPLYAASEMHKVIDYISSSTLRMQTSLDIIPAIIASIGTI